MLVWLFVVGFAIADTLQKGNKMQRRRWHHHKWQSCKSVGQSKNRTRKPEEHLFVVYRFDSNNNKAKSKKRQRWQGKPANSGDAKRENWKQIIARWGVAAKRTFSSFGKESVSRNPEQGKLAKASCSIGLRKDRSKQQKRRSCDKGGSRDTNGSFLRQKTEQGAFVCRSGTNDNKQTKERRRQ